MPEATKRLLAPAVIFVLLVAGIATCGLVLSGVVLAQQGNVVPVTNIAVCSGPNAGEVIVSWDTIPSATYYRIGYVNMVKDYPRAKASVTGEWIEAFVYVDVNARNIPSTGGRDQYTLHRLVQGDRHAFTVLTSNNVVNTLEIISGQYSWPQNPRWAFHEVTNPDPACSAAAPVVVRPTPTMTAATPTLTPTITPTPTRTPRPTPRPTNREALTFNLTECRDGRSIGIFEQEIIIRGTIRAIKQVDDVVVYGSLNKSNLPKANSSLPVLLFNVGSDNIGDMAAGETQSWDASYIHNGSTIGLTTCYAAVLYRDP